MKTFIILGLLFALTFSLFTETLKNKYSIEVIEEGTEGT
jgi:hypothetical protein